MKKTTILFIALLTLSNLQAQEPTFEWVAPMGGRSTDAGFSLSFDSKGAIYSTGYFHDTVDFNPGMNDALLISKGSIDVFISKLDASGNFVWAKSFGGLNQDEGRYITVDKNDDILLAGYFDGTVDFDPGPGSFILTNGNHEISHFICKLDAKGNFLWAKKMAGRNIFVRLDNNDNIYVAGSFRGTRDFDPGSSTHFLSANGDDEAFICKLSSAGDFIWAKSTGGIGDDLGRGIAFDSNNNVVVLGAFEGLADFNPDGFPFFLNAGSQTKIFIAKFSNVGTFITAIAMAGYIEYGLGNLLEIDASNNLYVAGNFKDTIDVDPSSSTFNLTSVGKFDGFISKLTPSGALIWAQSLGGLSYDDVNAVTLDPAENLYITGNFFDSLSFSSNPGQFELVGDDSNTLIAKYSPTGNLLWAESFGSQSATSGYSIKVDNAYNIYTAGFFRSRVDFDTGADTLNIYATAESDIFIHKMSQPTIGINETHSDLVLTLYPNPTDGLVNIHFKSEDINAGYSVLTSGGQTLKKGKIENYESVIDLTTVAKGIYFLRINTEHGFVVYKLIRS